MRVLAALALAAAASSDALARATAPPANPPATLRVTGRARLVEAPDRVYVDIGVTTEAPSSRTATSENASRLNGVIGAIRRGAGPGAQLTTIRYLLTPDYRYHPNGTAPTIVGYTVTNVVELRLDELDKIGRVLDAATQAGANRVESIRFALRDAEAAKMQALREAALDARAQARALAGALGLRIVRIASADEQSPAILQVHPIFAQSARVDASREPTPLEPGSLDVDASVALTVEVAPQER
jgi:uncharacterized protein